MVAIASNFMNEMAIPRPKVMVVEDDPDSTVLITQILKHGGFDTVTAANGVEALEKRKESDPDLVLLDLMMPVMDGWQTLKEIRKVSDVPVIVLTASNARENVVPCLQDGADDYMTKPFFKNEVLERIRAVLRRVKRDVFVGNTQVPALGITIDANQRLVLVQDKAVQLTDREFAVFKAIYDKYPKLLVYKELAEQVWGEDSVDARKRIKFLVYQVRKKLARIDPALEESIVNIERLGYKIQRIG